MYARCYVMQILCDFVSCNQTNFKSTESHNGWIKKLVWLWHGNLGIATEIARYFARRYNATFLQRFAQHCVWVWFFTTFYAMSHKKMSRKPTLFFFIQKHWFLPVLLGCYDILMDVMVCDTLWYLIRPIRRLLKIAFCEMWRIILCLQCCAHIKDYVSKAIGLFILLYHLFIYLLCITYMMSNIQ